MLRPEAQIEQITSTSVGSFWVIETASCSLSLGKMRMTKVRVAKRMVGAVLQENISA